MTEEEKKFVEEFTKKMISETEPNNKRIAEIYSEFGIDMDKLEADIKNVNPEKLNMKYRILHPDAVSPSYNYPGDSGFDLYAIEEVVLEPLGRGLVGTGLSFDIPDTFEIQVRSKSGLAINQGLMCLNSPGTVDSGYLGEIKVILFNTNKEPFVVKKGMKIAQAVITRVANGAWVEFSKTEKITNKDRGANGFGSTGV